MTSLPLTTLGNEESGRPAPPVTPWCLFLDIDGTLLDIAPTPDLVEVDASLLDLLRRLGRACDGALALITGRPIAAVDALFAPLLLPVAGVHGFERLARLVSAALPAFELLDGDHVVEIKPVEHDKSTAIEAYMQEDPFIGRSPVFIGDDTADLDGFAAVKRFNGLAIAAGSRIPGEKRLAGPRDVRRWLESLLTA